MHPIQETIERRAAERRIDHVALPAVAPFARLHVEQLQADGATDLVLRQLMREAQSVRRTRSEAALLALIPGFNVEKFEEGFDALCAALATGKKTKRKVSKLDHKGGQFNPVNALAVEEQATAVWAGVCSLVGEMADSGNIGKVTTQKLAKAVAGKLREATENAPEYGRLGYERAALVLIDNLCASTGWLEEVDIGRKLVSVEQEPKRVALTKKFIAEVLGGQELPADLSERKPMLVPPVPWTTKATYGGYLHNGIPAIRGTRAAIESLEIVSALNLLQATAFRVNARVLTVAKHFRINAALPHAVFVHGRFIEDRHDIPEHVQGVGTMRSALTIGALAELVDAEEFFFPWNLDWRGRMAERINECFADVVPGMLQAMSYLQAVTDVLTVENIALCWTTPVGLRVEQARVKTNVVRLESHVGERRTRTFHIETEELSKSRQRSGVSPNFVHGIDASHMTMTVNALGAQGVRNLWMVHDSFGAPFANCQQIFDATRDQFVKLMSRDLLKKWTDDVTTGLSGAGKAKLPNLPNYGLLDLAAVRNSIYAWY